MRKNSFFSARSETLGKNQDSLETESDYFEEEPSMLLKASDIEQKEINFIKRIKIGQRSVIKRLANASGREPFTDSAMVK